MFSQTPLDSDSSHTTQLQDMLSGKQVKNHLQTKHYEARKENVYLNSKDCFTPNSDLEHVSDVRDFEAEMHVGVVPMWYEKVTIILPHHILTNKL